jgi:oligoendopeptidase F
MAVDGLRARADVPAEETWDLTAIFPSPEAWEAAIEELRAELPKLTALKGTLDQGPRQLLQALRIEESIGERLSRIFAYAGLMKDQDNTDAEALARYDRAVGLSVEVAQAASFLEPEILALPDGTVERYLSEEPELEHYRHALDNLLRLREHVLTAEIEALLAGAGEVAIGPNQIFTMLNNADISHGTITDENGQEMPLTKGNFLRFLESRSREVRRQSFVGMHKAYLEHRNTLAATYSSAVKTDIFFARARKYPSALEASLTPVNIPVAVYDNLVETVNRHLPLLHRYIALRKRALGLERLGVHDLYVPIVPEIDLEYTYEQGVETVLRALGPLGENYRTALARGLDSRWVDIYENKGKTSGAYSWGVYGVHPFMLLNWSSRLDDVFTLAHEVGHAMHSYYSSAAQPYTYGHYTLFVAEVASTVNEMILTDVLRRETDNRVLQMYLINHGLEDFRGTLFRQTMFAEFERWAHERAEAGQALTPDALTERYRELVGRYYGTDVEIDEHVAIEWARIPHFYRAFYVYQYATGISAAAAISKAIITEGQPALERYLRFLSGGSSKYPLDLLRDAGVDMTTPRPIEDALAMFGELLGELERLMAEPASTS